VRPSHEEHMESNMKTAINWNRWMRLAAAAAGFAGIVVALPVRAADSINVPVSATVLGVCKFSTGQSPSVVIANSGANIDPSLAGSATGSANVLYRCTKGSAPAFALTGGASLTLTCAACGGATMTATMSLTPPGSPNGQGFATDLTLVLTGTIPSATYSTAAAGTYNGTQTVTVTP
jgi:hypothetical protein